LEQYFVFLILLKLVFSILLVQAIAINYHAFVYFELEFIIFTFNYELKIFL